MDQARVDEGSTHPFAGVPYPNCSTRCRSHSDSIAQLGSVGDSLVPNAQGRASSDPEARTFSGPEVLAQPSCRREKVVIPRNKAGIGFTSLERMRIFGQNRRAQALVGERA